jgi:hypothetical protein
VRRVRRERHESTVPPDGGHPADSGATVEIGGASILSLLISDPQDTQNDLRQDLWRAGHAHAGVWLILSLVALRYVDEATLSEGMTVGGAPVLPGCGYPDAVGLLPVGSLPGGDGAQRDDLPSPRRRGRAGGGTPGSGSRPHPGTQDVA